MAKVPAVGALEPPKKNKQKTERLVPGMWWYYRSPRGLLPKKGLWKARGSPRKSLGRLRVDEDQEDSWPLLWPGKLLWGFFCLFGCVYIYRLTKTKEGWIDMDLSQNRPPDFLGYVPFYGRSSFFNRNEWIKCNWLMTSALDRYHTNQPFSFSFFQKKKITATCGIHTDLAIPTKCCFPQDHEKNYERLSVA